MKHNLNVEKKIIEELFRTAESIVAGARQLHYFVNPLNGLLSDERARSGRVLISELAALSEHLKNAVVPYNDMFNICLPEPFKHVSRGISDSSTSVLHYLTTSEIYELPRVIIKATIDRAILPLKYASVVKSDIPIVDIAERRIHTERALVLEYLPRYFKDYASNVTSDDHFKPFHYNGELEIDIPQDIRDKGRDQVAIFLWNDIELVANKICEICGFNNEQQMKSYLHRRYPEALTRRSPGRRSSPK